MPDANSAAKELVTRFAPSPTGRLHLGGARTALFCMALARASGGRFLLRIEDTDRERSDEDAEQELLESLFWLGIRWDEGPVFIGKNSHVGTGGDPRGVGPFRQSERHAAGIYEKAVKTLLEKDLAYPAFETPEELDAMRDEARQKGEDFRYRRAPNFDREAALARRAKGDPHVIRFRMPEQAWRVDDKILGAVDFAGELYDDFVLVKRDGWPTYHLACVVDDEAMGVTHVLRGQEHLNNTPRHIALQQALGYGTPVYAHLPVILNADGSKMSKRDDDFIPSPTMGMQTQRGATPESRYDDAKHYYATRIREGLVEILCSYGTRPMFPAPGEHAVNVDDLRLGGYLPEAIVNTLALLGWNPGEKGEDGKDLERFDLEYLCAHFSLERVGSANARFDRDKLLAFNKEALGALGTHDLEKRFPAWVKRYKKREMPPVSTKPEWFYEALKTRCSTLNDLVSDDGPAGFFYSGDDDYTFDEKAVKKWLLGKEQQGCELLPALQERLAAFPVRDFTPEAIETAVKEFCEARGVRMGAAAQALRVAVTGTAASPPLGLTLALLGPGSVRARITYCLEKCCPNQPPQ